MDPEVKIPPGSGKAYKSLVLENGLKVMLISNPTDTESAVAMTVGVGSSSDPSEAQGLAHLLEHMLFKGSKAYPHPNELKDFLAQHNGEANAYTEMDFIMFHMNVLNVGFDGALKRFCESFIEPLFKEDCLESEITAIEHEFEGIRFTDKSRLDQLRGHTAPKGHPFNRFTWGNRASLSSLRNDELIELLRNLFDKSFVGSSMNLVIHSNKSVDVLKAWATLYFGRIKHGPKFSSNSIASTTSGPIWKPDPIWKPHTLFHSKSVEDAHIFDITWIIPPMSYKKIPEQFLVIAFNLKDEGSLYSLLRKKGWLISLEASSGDYKFDDDESEGTYACTSVGRLFSLSLELTNLGCSEVFDIVGHVYHYLQFLRYNQAPCITEEFFQVRNIKYHRFDIYDLGASDGTAFTKKIAGKMLHVPLEDAISSDFLTEKFTSESILELLDCFKPSSMRLDLVSRTFEGEDLLEPMFDNYYKEQIISSDLICRWLNSSCEDASFHFPPKSRFLPTEIPPLFVLEKEADGDAEKEADGDAAMEEADGDAAMEEAVGDAAMEEADGDAEEEADGDAEEEADGDAEKEADGDAEEEADGDDEEEADGDDEEEADGDDESDEEEAESSLLVDKPSMKLWYIPDDSVPTFVFSVISKIEDDLKSQVLGALFLHLLKDSLAPVLSEGERANLSTSITLSDKNKIEVKISGFKERFHLYISTIWKVLTSFSPSPDSFMTDKEVVASVLKNNVVELLDHSSSLLQEVVSASCYPVGRMLQTLELVKFEDIIQFLSDLRSEMFIEGVFWGNILRDDALGISALFKSDEIIPLKEDLRYDLRIYLPLYLPPALQTPGNRLTNIVDDFVWIKSEINSLARLCFQIGTDRDDARDTALLHLFHSLIEENLVYSLRGKSNLGYEVGSGVEMNYGIKILTVSVISSVHNPAFLIQQIGEYFKGLPTFLTAVEPSVFQNHKNAVLGNFPDDDGENLWEQISGKRMFHDFNKRVRQNLKKITKKDVLKFHSKYLIEAYPETRMLSIRIWGCNCRSMFTE